MSRSGCWSCLGELPDGARYHPSCVRALFGGTRVPSVDVDLARLHTLALAMVGHTSLSGVQRKISLRRSPDRQTLQVALAGAVYLLKPQAHTFPHLPENEHVTMRMAREVGIAIPPCGLVALKDGSLAYLVKRFDRLDDGAKLLLEDFCQLSERSPKDKYRGSSERCMRLATRYATEPLIEAQKLFRLLLFSWWSGNGDTHLKNFSLLREPDGRYLLAPAYDLLCTRLVIPEDPLVLPVDGTTKPRSLRPWLTLAKGARIPERAARGVVKELVAAAPACLELLSRSALPTGMKAEYRALLEERTAMLAGA